MRFALQLIRLVGPLCAMTATVPVLAQDDPCQPRDGLSTCFAADNLWPHVGNSRWLSLASTQTTPDGAVAVGLVPTYIHKPVGLTIASPDPDGTTVYAIEHAFSTTVLIGVGLTERLQFQLGMPMVLYQEGAGKQDVTGASETLTRSAVGDARFGVAFTAIERGRGDTGPGLAVRFDMAAPTAPPAAYAGYPSATYAPGATLDYRGDRFAVGVDVGARLRESAKVAGAFLGSQVSVAIGGSYDILEDDWLSANLEANALVGLVNQLDPTLSGVIDPHIPAEWMASFRTAALADGSVAVSLGGGSFIPTAETSAVTTPLFRLALGLQYTSDPFVADD